MKHIINRLIACALCCALCAACAPALGDDAEHLTDNWYEIFVRSFYDSDGDRVGDLNGITQKLDYLKDLSVGGLWLMPIHPSPSYHGYDVSDYCAINPEYGTMEDFQTLLKEAHARGIRIILDLVVNHSSNQHPWFVSARANEDSPYRAYYNWSDTSRTGYNGSAGNYFESRFVASMPDLNLDNPAVREEIVKIMDFWLQMGVDGFRLDAVTSYYTNNLDANIAFLKWISDEAHAIKPDCIMVGEAWEDINTIARYYESGMDSFFLFPVSQQGGYIAKILSGEVEKKGLSLGNVIALLERTLPGKLMTPFLGNHDNARIANAVGTQTPTNCKMAVGLLSILKGSVFVYYGDEIGMTGTGNDPNKRIGMYWDSKMTITRAPQGATEAKYVFGSVLEQSQSALSILTYYQNALRMRALHPAIARGDSVIHDQPNEQVCLIERVYGDQSVLIAVNLSIDDAAIPLPASALGYGTLSYDLEIWGEAALADGTLTLPAYGIAVLTH